MLRSGACLLPVRPSRTRAAVPSLVWMRRRSATRRARPLTQRECLILDRIGRDRTHKDIAAELGVSINIVANLAAKAYRKLGAHCAAAAVLAARGERPEVIQRVMRHSKVSFTIDRYVKVYREDVRDAVQRNDRQQTATS